MAIGVIAPALRRYRRTASALLLVFGAATLVGLALTTLIHQDPRAGLAAIEANRRFALLIAGCELPAFALALISLKWLDKLYWIGWGIHIALTAWLAVVIVWLEFFWHW